LATLLILAAVCYIAAYRVRDDNALHDVLRSVAEGLFVAFILAATGDYYLRVKLAQDSIRQGVKSAIAETFGFLDPSQPPELAAAVQEFASGRIFLTATNWKMKFDWHDREQGVLVITLTVQSNGRCLRLDGYLPSGETWVLESTLDYKSDFLRYTLQCPQAGIDVDESEEDLAPYCRRADGRVLLDRDRVLANRLTASQRVTYRSDFNRTVAARMYRRTPGYVPLTHTHFSIVFGLEITGDAVEDLSFTAFHPKSDDDQSWQFVGRAESRPVRHQWRNVTPGQATIVSWTRIPQTTTSASRAARVIPSARSVSNSSE
jgi:hypothetical protein